MKTEENCRGFFLGGETKSEAGDERSRHVSSDSTTRSFTLQHQFQLKVFHEEVNNNVRLSVYMAKKKKKVLYMLELLKSHIPKTFLVCMRF